MHVQCCSFSLSLKTFLFLCCGIDRYTPHGTVGAFCGDSAHSWLRSYMFCLPEIYWGGFTVSGHTKKLSTSVSPPCVIIPLMSLYTRIMHTPWPNVLSCRCSLYHLDFPDNTSIEFYGNIITAKVSCRAGSVKASMGPRSIFLSVSYQRTSHGPVYRLADNTVCVCGQLPT